jgi:hypothetical protein
MIANSIAGLTGIIVPFTTSGGNETETIGSFKYHVFTGNGTLTVTGSGDISVMSCGGGAGGGYFVGGGGGGGELDLFGTVSVSTNTYDVVIGGGGAGGTSGTYRGASGGTTTFKRGATT